MDRIRRLEKVRNAKRPPGYIWVAYLTEVSPGLYAFDIPEELHGKTATGKEIDGMNIGFIICEFLSGKCSFWHN